jgi:sugar phosphate isomerase/epimerase
VTREFGLCHYTMIDVPPPEFVNLASSARFVAVSLMLELPHAARSSVAWMDDADRCPMHGNTPLRRETKRVLDGTGVMVVDASTCRIESDTDVEGFRPMIESAAYLGARQVNVNGNDPERSRLTDRFAELAAIAAEYALPVGIEFQMISEVKTLSDALELIARSGVSNAAVTVDALHLARSGGSPADIARLEPSRISYAQLCDGPADADTDRYQWEAGVERMLPGSGELPLRSLVQALPVDVVLGAEVPSQSRREAGLSAHQYAAEVMRSLVSVVDDAAQERHRWPEGEVHR